MVRTVDSEIVVRKDESGSDQGVDKCDVVKVTAVDGEACILLDRYTDEIVTVKSVNGDQDCEKTDAEVQKDDDAVGVIVKTLDAELVK